MTDTLEELRANKVGALRVFKTLQIATWLRLKMRLEQ